MGTFLLVLMSLSYFRNIAHDSRVTLYEHNLTHDSITLSRYVDVDRSGTRTWRQGRERLVATRCGECWSSTSTTR